MILKKPAQKKTAAWNKIKYVRSGTPSAKSRGDRSQWKRTIHDFICGDEQIVLAKLHEDGWLLDWQGRTCPWCGVGKLGPMKGSDERHSNYRCNNGRLCGKRVTPLHGHPILPVSNGNTWQPLGQRAAVVFCIVSGCSNSSIHKLLGVNHKAIERINKAIQALQQRHVERVEADIQFGDGKRWVDIEADEAMFRKQRVTDPHGLQEVEWEQWAGVVQRGRPESLVLWRTASNRTCLRAPGPGAIRKTDWKPFALKRLQHRRLILHTDGARSYKMKIPGMLHDWVVHKKKKVKNVWLKPKYVVIKKHWLPCGTCLTVKGGTQIIDRAWRDLKKHLGARTYKPNSPELAAAIRSGQWNYWHRNADLFTELGKLVDADMKARF